MTEPNGTGINLEKAIEQANNTHFSRESIAEFGNIIRDRNPIHRYLDAAQGFGFTDTPVMGVHLASIGAQIADALARDIQSVHPDYHLKEQITQFKKPVFPSTKLIWHIGSINEDGKDLVAQITAKEADETKVAIEARLSDQINEYQTNPQVLYTEPVEIKPEDVLSFNRQLRGMENPKPHYSQGMALIPSTLLTFLEELNKESNKNVLGANIKMETRIYKPLEMGDASIKIYEVSQRGKGQRVIYTFDGILEQTGIPTIGSRITCLANGELDVNLIARKKQSA